MECRAAGLLSTASTSEITHEPSGTGIEELGTEEQSQLDLDEVYDQLEQMKQRAIQLRKVLVREQPVTVEYAKCLQDIEKHGSQNADVRQVQLQTAQIASQMATLARRMKGEGKHLKDLNCRILQSQQQSQKLHTCIEKLQKWPSQQKLRAGLCLERYNDLSISCCSSVDFRCFMEQLYKSFHYACRTRVPDRCFRMDQRHVSAQLNRTENMICDAFKSLMQQNNELMRALHNYTIMGGHVPKALESKTHTLTNKRGRKPIGSKASKSNEIITEKK